MPDWRDRAACRGLSDWFVMPEDMPRQGAHSNHFWARARAVCTGCPVRRDCLQFAFTEVPGDDCAMYAGLSPGSRKKAAYRYRKEMAS